MSMRIGLPFPFSQWLLVLRGVLESKQGELSCVLAGYGRGSARCLKIEGHGIGVAFGICRARWHSMTDFYTVMWWVVSIGWIFVF